MDLLESTYGITRYTYGGEGDLAWYPEPEGEAGEACREIIVEHLYAICAVIEERQEKRDARAERRRERAVGNPAELYGLGLPEGRRRSEVQIQHTEEALYDLLQAMHPMTVRQTFYQAEVRGIVEKTEAGYKLVSSLLTRMRKSGELRYDWISDNTRWMRKPTSFNNLDDMLLHSQHFYRRSVWADQAAYVEIWCEKDALAGIIYEETKLWDVPLMINRGFSSVTFLYEAGQAIAAQKKPAFIYYLGDFDPSGEDIARNIEDGLRTHAPRAELHFEVVAVTPAQILALGLPTRPVKEKDSRAKKSQIERCVELDSLPPAYLRGVVRQAIERHIDPVVLARTRAIEQAERDSLGLLHETFRASRSEERE
jgi:hypothetical protein